jgi:ribosomal protein L37AE/L43A
MKSVERIFGLNGTSGKPLHLCPNLCPNCGADVIAATWSERLSVRCIRNVWSCDACGYEFETSAYLPFQQAEQQPRAL